MIELAGLSLVDDLDNIYKDGVVVGDELKIRTHYEGLDIAGRQRVHYLCFALPRDPLPDIDAQLHQRLMDIEKGGEYAGDDWEGVDFVYYNAVSGYMVLTEKYLLDRGYCCGNGCRHCPYDYENVAEPMRSQLQTKRKIDGNTRKDH